MSPHAQVRIDLAAISANVAAVGERVAGAHPAGHTPSLMSVVKADAYGHGLVPVARAALAGGAMFLGTAVFAEALALRAAGVGGRVLAWLAAPGENYAAVLRADIEIGVSSRWQLVEVVTAAAATGRTAAVHLKVDTGLGRNGCPAASWPELVAAAAAAQASGSVRVAGVFSHLACSDSPDHPATDEQLADFAAARRVLEAAGVQPEFVHLANSAATLTRPDTHFDLLRVGLATYGLSPIPELATAAELGLVPAMRLSARLAGVKEVPAGQGVSYDLTYRTPAATRLGLVPLGYADGIPRAASGGDHGPGGPVLVGGPVAAGGRVHRVVGRVAMDQVVLDLGPGSPAEPGDEVVLFGSGADGEPTVQDWAAAADTISYEITTRIARHVPRVYVGAAVEAGVGAHTGGQLTAGVGGPGG